MIRGALFDVTGVLSLPDAAWIAARLRRLGLVTEPNALDRAYYLATLAYDEQKSKLAARAGAIAGPIPPNTFGTAYARGAGLPVAEASTVERLLLTEPMPLSRRNPLPAAATTLRRLSERGLRLGIVANSDDGRTAEWLQHWNIWPSGEKLTIADSALVGARKPDPRIFTTALAGLGLVAGQVVHVGDSLHMDVDGARAAGLRCLHFDPHRLCPRMDHPHARTLGEVVEHLVSSERTLGGAVTGAVRAGDTVRRSTGNWSTAVHALLLHLERKGFAEAPRVLGIDERGREILTYLAGETVSQANSRLDEADRDELLHAVGRVLRRYHEVVRDFRVPADTAWRFRRAGVAPGEIVCHNDLAPRNTICRGTSVVGFIDWDGASPHRPVWDVAHAAWQFVPLQHDALCRREGWDEPPDRRSRFRIFCDAYGVASPARLLTVVHRRIIASRDGIRRLAREGHPAYRRLADAGHIADMERTLSFLDETRAALTVP